MSALMRHVLLPHTPVLSVGRNTAEHRAIVRVEGEQGNVYADR